MLAALSSSDRPLSLRREPRKRPPPPQQPTRPDESSSRASGPRSPALPSSFLAVPTTALTGTGILAPAARLLLLLRPQTYAIGARAVRQRLQRLLGGAGDGRSEVAAAARALVVAVVLPAAVEDEGLLPAIWCLLRDAVFFVDDDNDDNDDDQHRAQRRARRVLLVVCAVVANHARRTFFVLGAGGAATAAAAWLGAATIAPRAPDAAWSLVRARPDVFLAEATTAAAGYTGLSTSTATAVARTLAALAGASLRKRAWDVVAGGGAALVLGRARDGRRRRSHPPARGAHDIAAVVFLVWLCSCVEYAVDRAFHAAVWAAACGAVVREAWPAGGREGVDGAGSPMLAAACATVPLLAMVVIGSAHMAGYGAGAVVPLVRASVGRAGVRQPGLLVALAAAVGAVHALVRFRSRVYLATEASGLFVCGGYAALGALLVALAGRARQRQQQQQRPWQKVDGSS